MAADTAGNDVTLVGVPLTGFLAYAPEASAIPTPSEGGAAKLALDAAFKKAGLLTEEGGFEWTEEPDGDALEFWQSGYSIPSGKAKVELTFTAAEESPITRALRTGTTADANGYITVDGGGNATKYVFFTEEAYANGAIRRRVAVGRVKTAKLAKSERGKAQGTEFTIEISRDARFDNKHYGEWVLAPEGV